ncbi:probable NPP1 domain protein [Ramularia collo-cygni]|uniref:Probable NPP1 domain protein n=1 Tax=Ramularia collo-cygni TaxID=112498 RepID=A0A2D3V4X9_9PEZI|nr:probable NPP1 domain protein [Ramularia collo-cygni]CZT20500.1 probable NPP1 domain protein [Ramularia collo-cygni]
MKIAATIYLAIATAFAASIQRRAVIAHDAVVGFPQTVPSGTIGQLYLKYKPYLKVDNGCVPFPAVDASGNTGGGLNPTGGSNSGCSSSTGQVYARSATYGSSFAIMYSWYMPKDSPSTGLGHRHDWEGIVVWLSGATLSAQLLGVAASAHGDYDTTTTPNLSGTSPLIRYFSIFPVNHQLGFTSTVGGQQPLIAYESLTSAARSALESTDFGSANVPFKDSNFQSNLANAAL